MSTMETHFQNFEYGFIVLVELIDEELKTMDTDANKEQEASDTNKQTTE